jgi:RimJ/RimL family protein N-acetyltransferase
MKLLPLDRIELIELVGGWLGQKENYQWLDFGGGRPPTPALVKIMAQRDTNVLRVFTADDDATPIGVVGLSHIDRHHKTAMLWGVLGDRSHGRRGWTTRALSKMLTVGFHELGLEAIHSWSVATNVSGIEVTKRLNFRFVGRHRQCHTIDGQRFDRVLFDLLAEEHKEICDA